MVSASTMTGQAAPAGLRGQITIIGVLFFVLGFFTWMNGPLITFVKLAFTLSDVGAFLVPMVFYLSYFFFALPAAFMMRSTGLKAGIVIGLLMMAVGAAIFGEFATVRSYPGALTGLFIVGGGLAVLQTAVNPYISIIGPIESAARRIAIMGIANKVAGMLAPPLLGTLVLQGLGSLAARVSFAPDRTTREALLNSFAAKIHYPYLIMAGLVALLAVFIYRSHLPNIQPDKVNSGASSSADQRPNTTRLWLGVLCLFVYVGAEVMAGDAIGTYAQFFDIPLDQTKFLTSFTLGAMLIGYIVGFILIPRFIAQETYLSISGLLGGLLTIGAYLTFGYTSVFLVAALGFANAMMWPAIFPLGIKNLGSKTEIGSALMVMGICGGALIPQLFVGLKQAYNMQTVFLAIMLPSYLYIAFFGWWAKKADAVRHGFQDQQ